jgi:hypothetical protein
MKLTAFRREKQCVCSMFKILSTYSCRKKYIKCNIWRVEVRPSYIEDARFLKVKGKCKDATVPVQDIKVYRENGGIVPHILNRGSR